jgi:hypothetical protein
MRLHPLQPVAAKIKIKIKDKDKDEERQSRPASETSNRTAIEPGSRSRVAG